MKNFWSQLISYLRKNRRPLLTLFLIALLIRLAYFLTHIPFSQDQVRDVLFIRDQLANLNFYIPLGPAAASYSNFNVLPFYYYLQLFAHLLFGNTFFAMSIFQILLEALSPILLFYLLSRIGLNKKLCFLGGLLYALNPATISLAISAWNPNLIPFFTLILLIAGLWYLLDDRLYGLSISIVAFVLMTGLHFQWFVLLPFVFIIFIKALFQIKKTYKILLPTLAICLLLLSPYLYSEFTNHFQNFRHSLEFLTSAPTTFERISKPVYLFFFFPNYYNRLFFNSFFVYSWTWLYESYAGPELRIIIASLCFWSIFAFNCFSAYRHRRRRSGQYLAATLLIFISMAIFLRFYKGDKPDYFLNVFIPFIFIWLMQALSLIKNYYFQMTIIILIVLIGNCILWTQPWYNQYADYQQLDKFVKNKMDSDRQLVILNQEIERPIRYFLPDENFVASPSGTATNTFFICFSSQDCPHYEPNLQSENNIFKYDLVTPVNYGVYYPRYNYYQSGGWRTDTLSGFLVVNQY